MTDLAAACWSAVDEAGPRDATVVVGLSVGAIIAKHMAAQRPEQVRALVLTGGGYHGSGRPSLPTPKGIAPIHVPRYRSLGLAYRREHFARNFTGAFLAGPLYRWLVDLAIARGGDAEGIVRLLLALEEPDPPGLHASIRAPTLIVTGGADRSRTAQEELARRIAGAELRVIEGAGHCCNLERPAEYDRLVLEHLVRLGLVPKEAAADKARPAAS
jgi:3-oxoadipate enol-lactonase